MSGIAQSPHGHRAKGRSPHGLRTISVRRLHGNCTDTMHDLTYDLCISLMYGFIPGKLLPPEGPVDSNLTMPVDNDEHIRRRKVATLRCFYKIARVNVVVNKFIARRPGQMWYLGNLYLKFSLRDHGDNTSF